MLLKNSEQVSCHALNIIDQAYGSETIFSLPSTLLLRVEFSQHKPLSEATIGMGTAYI